jgi:hypothetical protein
MIPSATELLLALDAQRPRTLQAEMGMSSLGDCRRRAGYHAQGYPADPECTGNGIQAMLGTAIHEALAQAARLVIPGAHAEDLEVWFAGLKGHPDLYVDRTVRDYKTNGYTLQVENRRQLGPKTGERWQSHTYGAALIVAGYPVDTVQIDYVARDSGDEFLFTEPFDVDVVAEAMAWLKDVRETPVDLLPRDYRPDSATCRGCRFFRRCWEAEPGHGDDRHVLFLDEPDAALWARRLESARERKKLAESDEADAKGALDHLRGVGRPGEREEIEVPGLDKVIKFTVKRGRASPDMARIAADYKRAGARPPFLYGEPTVSIALVKPKKGNADG